MMCTAEGGCIIKGGEKKECYLAEYKFTLEKE